MVGRRAGVGVILGAAVTAVCIAYANESAPAASTCAATPVRWEWNKLAPGFPWIAVGPTKARLHGALLGYRYLGDGRVNASEGVVLLAGRALKIAWYSTKWGGSNVRLTGRRLDGPDSFRYRFGASLGAGWYPSGITVPAAGCWELTLKTDGWTRRVVVKAVDPAPEGTCDATPAGADGSVRINPARSGVSGLWPWRTEDNRALLYAGGRSPDGKYAKVLWRGRPLGGTLVVSGSRLDGQATFRQEFKGAGGPTGTGYWPSTVIAPEPGCWLLTVRIVGQTGAAGIVVTRVVSP
jgi:hypothetical protein